MAPTQSGMDRSSGLRFDDGGAMNGHTPMLLVDGVMVAMSVGQPSETSMAESNWARRPCSEAGSNTDHTGPSESEGTAVRG